MSTKIELTINLFLVGMYTDKLPQGLLNKAKTPEKTYYL